MSNSTYRRQSTIRLIGAICFALSVLITAARPTSKVIATAPATLNLSGSGAYVRVPNAAALNPSGGITIEAWVRRNDPARCEAIVGKNYSTGYWFGFCNSKLAFYVDAPANIEYSARNVEAGEWAHVAATYDGTTLRMYINGKLEYHNTRATARSLPLNSQDLLIGAAEAPADESGPTNYFSGNLAEVRLWSSTRSQTEIRRTMVQQLTTPQPELVANWNLEGTANDVFGRHNGSAVGGTDFTGPAAPPIMHDAILIPRIDPGTPPLYECSSPVRLPIWYRDPYGGYSPIYVSLGATASDLLICMRDMVRQESSSPGAYAAVYLDLDDSGGSSAQRGDYVVSVDEDNTNRSLQGDGSGDYRAPGLTEGDYSATTDQSREIYWDAKFRIRRSVLGTNSQFGLAFIHHWLGNSGDDHGWPLDVGYNNPNTWPSFRINDSAPVRADAANPTVTLQRVPATIVRRGQAVRFTATVSDDVDIGSIDLTVDGRVVRSCSTNGTNERSATCDFEGSYPLGRHTYSARAVDHRGRLAFTGLMSFLVQHDGRPPEVTASHAPRDPALNQPVTLNVQVTDPSGIREIRLDFDASPYGHLCRLSGQATASCSVRVTPPAGRRILYYSAMAVDQEGLETRTARVPILFGNTGADTDDDGLADEFELLLGTSTTNVDTDHDALRDDWEVLGLRFPDGDVVNLPALGSNPRLKDIFLQYDYERGARVEPEVIPYVTDLYRQHGITLHVTENERPRNGVVSTVGAEQVATRTTPDGRYYFPPKLNYTHHYMFSRHNPGLSGAWHYFGIDVNTNNCPLTSSEPQTDPACGPRNAQDQTYRVMHELGHNLGLGHGGRQGSNVQTLVGDFVVYSGNWDNLNLKPNYISVMNYGYTFEGDLCYNPTTNAWLRTTTYSDEQLPELDETRLAEADSSFAAALQARTCGSPGFVPVFQTGCTDDSGTMYVVLSDGTRALARIRSGSTWQTSGLPALGTGIDWNCDNTIGGDVSENINGDGGSNWFNAGTANETMHSSDDWANIPFHPGPGCFILRDTSVDAANVFPEAYRRSIGRSDCRIGSATGSGRLVETPEQQSEQAQVVPNGGQPHTDPFADDGLTLPNVEACDGVNNDGDGELDEGCLDTDKDGTVDGVDNCVQTVNADQSDLDGNFLGDACQNPTITDLAAQKAGQSVTLNWKAPTTDILGFNLYRRCPGSDSPQVLGSQYPSTRVATFVDTLPSSDVCHYSVRPVNANGVETDEARIKGDGTPVRVDNKVSLPLVQR